MSHEIVVFNKNNEEIAYLRFSMGNPAALIVYDLLDAQAYNGGVSGIGRSMTVPYTRMNRVLNDYQIIIDNVDMKIINEFTKHQLEEIKAFFQNGVETSKMEEVVEVLFC